MCIRYRRLWKCHFQRSGDSIFSKLFSSAPTMEAPVGPPKQNLTDVFSKVGNYDGLVCLNVASLYKNFKLWMGGVKYNCVILKGGGNTILASNFSFTPAPPPPPSPVINDRSLMFADVLSKGCMADSPCRIETWTSRTKHDANGWKSGI